MDNDKKPLVTALLLAYNQNAYIREAVASVLSQTYEPLQIILSDDGSSDVTAAIIRDMARSYAGPHRVTVNVNKKNLGIGSHVNKLFALADGELIVMFAGDDISIPDRVTQLVREWEDSGRSLTAIFSSATSITSDGLPVGPTYQWIRRGARDAHSLIASISWGHCIALGATAAYTPAVMTKIGALDASLEIEDIPLAIRASLLGGVGYIQRALVEYRVDVSVWRPLRTTDETFQHHRTRLSHANQGLLDVCTQVCRDASLVGLPSVADAAVRQSLMFKFVADCEKDHVFRLRPYLDATMRNRHLLPMLLLGLSFAHPRLHRVLFSIRKLFARLST